MLLKSERAVTKVPIFLRDAPDVKGQRRRSFYNFPFFLRHQDAVEETSTSSPQPQKRPLKDSDTNLSLTTSLEKVPVPPPATPKSKRATSFVKKKPPLERGFSAQSALRLNRNAVVREYWSRGISILDNFD